MQGSLVLKSNKIRYCDEAPFLSNASIMENIIGFSSFDATRYAEVMQATMLIEDFRNLPAGDKTIIGTNGVSLSGGQRQRVSLARALCHDADILVLDDVFSGLDGWAQDQVCQATLGPGRLLGRRVTTAIICTHSTQFLAVADHIVVLSSEGNIADQGSFKEIVRTSNVLEILALGALQTLSSDQYATLMWKGTILISKNREMTRNFQQCLLIPKPPPNISPHQHRHRHPLTRPRLP